MAIRPMVNGTGAAQQTSAAQVVLGALVGRTTATRRPRRAASRKAPARKARPARRAVKRVARLVKGSAAAKRYMASIRRKRRK